MGQIHMLIPSQLPYIAKFSQNVSLLFLQIGLALQKLCSVKTVLRNLFPVLHGDEPLLPGDVTMLYCCVDVFQAVARRLCARGNHTGITTASMPYTSCHIRFGAMGFMT